MFHNSVVSVNSGPPGQVPCIQFTDLHNQPNRYSNRVCKTNVSPLVRLNTEYLKYGFIDTTVEPLTNDHPHQRPSLSYDHISCDGQWFLFVYESLTSDHPSYTTTPMWFWGWSYKRGSTVQTTNIINITNNGLLPSGTWCWINRSS